MTRYKKIQARARALGIDTVQDSHGSPRGYWITKADGSALWDDENWASSLSELEGMVEGYARETAATA